MSFPDFEQLGKLGFYCKLDYFNELILLAWFDLVVNSTVTVELKQVKLWFEPLLAYEFD